MIDRRTRNEIIFLSMFAISIVTLLCFVPFCVTPIADCNCGHDGIEIEHSPEETSARKTRTVWFEQGTVSGVSQADFQRRVMTGIQEASAGTNTDFVQVQSKSGAWLRVFPATDEMMWKQRPDLRKAGLVPIELQGGNWMYLTTRNRWGKPEQKIIERAAKHGLGHRIGLGHVADPTSIMNINLGAMDLNAADRSNFAKRLK